MRKKLSFKPKDIEKLYSDQGSKYSEFAKDSFSWNYIEKPLLDDLLLTLKTKNIKILDVGCGMGRTLRYLVDKNIPAKNIMGMDISSEMLQIAKKTAPEVKVVKDELTNPKLVDKFDLIICTHVLHYLGESEFKMAMKSFYKLLNSGGTLFFVITHPVRTTRHNLAEYFKRDWILDHTPWGTTSPLFLRPVCDTVNETIRAGFKIKAVLEPVVIEEARKIDLSNYLRYSACPSRITVVAEKPPTKKTN